MLLPAEIESKTLIPALRAILAKDLSENHNVREEMISKMLGVTQAESVIIFVEHVVIQN